MDNPQKSSCVGCGALLEMSDGPTHRYMDSSAACYEVFNSILAAEYSDPHLLRTHRLTVDTYAIQHPGQAKSRQQIQSVGLHLARLNIQLAQDIPPKETNDVMLALGKHKHTLIHIEPPAHFRMTASDVVAFAGSNQHYKKVREWAQKTWEDWSDHHGYINDWTKRYL